MDASECCDSSWGSGIDRDLVPIAFLDEYLFDLAVTCRAPAAIDTTVPGVPMVEAFGRIQSRTVDRTGGRASPLG